jgi:LPS export ABC transporter protein LptC
MLTSNYAIDSTYANKMEAHEDVVVVNEKGERLNTEKLYWDRNTEQITSDVFVKITTEDQVIQGTGLISNQDFTEYRILNITGIINIDNDKSN